MSLFCVSLKSDFYSLVFILWTIDCDLWNRIQFEYNSGLNMQIEHVLSKKWFLLHWIDIVYAIAHGAFSQYTEAWRKWLPLLYLKNSNAFPLTFFIHFDSNFIEICSWGSSWRWVSIGAVKGLVSNRLRSTMPYDVTGPKWVKEKCPISEHRTLFRTAYTVLTQRIKLKITNTLLEL